MANHKSSEKRARSSERKRQRNNQYLSSVRTAVKKYRFALNGLTAGTGEDAKKVLDLLNKAQSALAKAAAKGLLHKNNASRSIARLTKAFKSAATAEVGTATKAKAKTAKKPAKKTAAKKTAKKKATKAKK